MHRLESGLPECERESSLRYQTRCLRCYPDATGFAMGSVEGRVAMEYFDMSEKVQVGRTKSAVLPVTEAAIGECLAPSCMSCSVCYLEETSWDPSQLMMHRRVNCVWCAVQARRYAFKCHRKSDTGKDTVYPVNALAFHPSFGTFASGGEV